VWHEKLALLPMQGLTIVYFTRLQLLYIMMSLIAKCSLLFFWTFQFLLVCYSTVLKAQEVHFSGYLGGSLYEQIRDITTDAAGNIYVTGGTLSEDFPVTFGAFQTEHNPGTPSNASIDPFDVFVTKMDPEGNIIWSTFLGGPNYDRAYAIRVDSAGNVYVAGRAGDGFPVTAGVFQVAFQGGQEAAFYGPQDGFIAKLNPEGSALIWASYFGTSDVRIIRDIAVDYEGNIYAASGWASGNYTPAVQAAFINSPAGDNDAVLAKVSPDGRLVLWATYVGGSDWESNENSVKIGADNDPYMLFTTESNGIATPDAYQTTYEGNQDFFISRFHANTGEVRWGTYLGGSENESTETHEFAVDREGNAYISGPTKSTDYPVTAGAFQTAFIGPVGFNDNVVSKISNDGAHLLASTYIGGNGADRSEGVAVDMAGQVFITGTTTSTNFPVTSDAFQITLADARDAFAVMIAPDFKTINYSTYMGSAGPDFGRCAVADASGNFLLAGEANGDGWPLIGQGQPFAGGSGAAIIAKFSSGTTLINNYLDEGNGILVYPNPATSELNIAIRKPEVQGHLQVCNTLGHIMIKTKVDISSSIKVNVNDLPIGVYFIQVLTSDHKWLTSKWIKI
jgi:hypothetical protein